MPVTFSNISVGESYTRRELAGLWGYAGYQTLARGVVTPRDDNKIILFVTKRKADYMAQYREDLDGDTLHWEGPTDHFAQARMLEASTNGDEIRVFYDSGITWVSPTKASLLSPAINCTQTGPAGSS